MTGSAFPCLLACLKQKLGFVFQCEAENERDAATKERRRGKLRKADRSRKRVLFKWCFITEPGDRQHFTPSSPGLMLSSFFVVMSGCNGGWNWIKLQQKKLSYSSFSADPITVLNFYQNSILKNHRRNKCLIPFYGIGKNLFSSIC